MDRQIECICSLSDAFGASGRQEEVLLAARKFLPGFETAQDSMQNLYITSGFQQSRPSVLLDGHSDEVGFMVQSIRKDGMLRILPLGGWNITSIISYPVTILTNSGQKVSGIVSTIPVHFSAAKSIPDWEDLCVDPGTSSMEETLNLGILPGDFIVPDVTCRYDEKRNLLIGKAFDCRIGCAALIETMIQARKVNLDFNVIGLLSSQEEVGERGMMAAMENLPPLSAAICFEGAPADDTFVQEDKIQCALKRGPMVRCMDKSMITHHGFLNLVRKTASENGIPVQYAVRKGGGTNGGVLHTRNIPCIVIGIPVRYAHASIGYVYKPDFDSAVALALALLKNFSQDVFASFQGGNVWNPKKF